jgi:hypothetical protein
MMRWLCLIALLGCADALRLPVLQRRQVLSLGAAAAVTGPLPALAKSKASVNPNKQCNAIKDDYGNEVEMCAGANFKDSQVGRSL